MQKENKEYCIWLVRSGGGEVKRLRVSVRMLCLSLVGLFTIVSCVAFILGDYSRNRLVAARQYLSILTLTQERDELVDQTAQLKEDLSTLEEKTSANETFEMLVRSRVQELASLLEGVVPQVAHRGQAVQGTEGVGGAEQSCDTIDCKASFNPASSLVPQREVVIGSGSVLIDLQNLVRISRKLPLFWPVQGTLTSGFGSRISPFTKRWAHHKGVDISNKHGTSIIVAGDGIVSAIKRNSTYGLMVDVDHGDGVATRYAHLSGASVTVGQKVRRGDAVGRLGSTGRSTGPHLHYEVRLDGKAVNPEKMKMLREQLATLSKQLLEQL